MPGHGAVAGLHRDVPQLLGDLLGRTRVFLAGTAVFTAASVLAGLATTPAVLIAARFLQGVGSAAATAVGLGILVTLFDEPRERARAIGVFAFTGAAGASLGTVLGGVLTDYLSWRWTFYINLPIGGAAMVAIFAFLRLPQAAHDAKGRTVMQRILSLDLPGTMMLVPAIVCLLLALQWGGTEHPWNSSVVIGLFVGFGLMAAVFIGIQIWKGDEGTLPPRLFKNKDVVCAMLFAFFFGAGFFPLVYYLCKFRLPLFDL